MANIAVFGGTLEYECSGDPGRPALLLLHALGSSLAMWDAQAHHYFEEFFVVRYSMRGHGGSTIDCLQELDVDALARDACAVLDHLAIDRAHWGGLSIGGMTAMWAAQHYAARVNRLVLASTAAQMPPPDLWAERIAQVLAQGVDALADAALERWFTAGFRARETREVARIRGIFTTTDPLGYASACCAIRDMDQRAGLATILAPTLVICGAHDPGITPAHAAELSGQIANARLVALPAAHLSNIEAEDAFNAAVMAHLCAVS